MQVSIDRALCEANAVCCGIAPDVFTLDEDELLHISLPIPPEHEPDVRKAADRCPKNALAVSDD